MDITTQLLASGHKYRKELLAMVFMQLAEPLKYMSLRVGVRGKETVGTIGSNAELRPYKSEKNSQDTTSIALRTLETFLGDMVEEFDPHLLASTVYGNNIGRDAKDFDIIKAIAMEMPKVVGEKLRNNLFSAQRNPNGTKTSDLFDGFSTIIEKEITAGNLTSEKGNFKSLSAIDATNAVDALQDFYYSATEHLTSDVVNLLVPYNIYRAYQQDFQSTVGPVVWNQKFEQTTLLGSDGKCVIAPMAPMSKTNHIILSQKNNLLVGCDQMSDTEVVRIRECDNPKMVQFFMKVYFGVEFESLDQKRLFVGKISNS